MDPWKTLHPDTDAPTGDAAAEFAALRDGRGVIARRAPDRFDLTGADTVDLLHRLAASEVRDLPVGSAARAVFTDDKGRLIDLPLLCTTETGHSLLCGDGRGPDLRAWIERFVITEDIAFPEPTPRTALGLVGEAAVHAAADALDDLVEHDDTWEAADLLLAAENALGPTLGHLEVETARAADLLDALAGQDVVPCGRTALTAWRIATGRVLPGPALATAPNPLEAGHKDLVSFTKGCYVGQEVVARLDTYDKVRRRVAWWDAESPAEAGADLMVEGRKVGRILESAPRLDAEGARALVLAETTVEDGTAVEAGGHRGTIRDIPR